MNYNDFFRCALSAAYKKAPMTDDDTFMSIIKERAKNMKKENSEHNGLVEVTTDYTEPKKSAKVLHAVAGIAGAAAVLTGAVFGLKFLNEHGGLKEGGSDDIRAGYHEEISEPAQSEAAVTENAIIASEDVRDKIEIDAVGKAVNGIVPMDETVELDGVKVHFTGYEFDSVSVKFYYDIKNNENGYRNSVRPINIGSKTFVPGHAGSLHDNSDPDDVLHCYSVFAVEGEPQTVRIPFGYAVFPEDFPAEPRTDEDELFAVTIHFDEDSALRTFWGRNIAIDENGGRVKLRDGFITPTHIMVSVENSFGVPDDQIEKLTAAVKMKDGTRLVPHLGSFIVDSDSDTRWLIYEFDEPIDISEVEEGTFHNFYFYGEDWEETKRMIDNYDKLRDIESSPLYTPADEWFDCDGKRVHVTGYAFDTVNLRIRYETCYDYSVKGLDGYDYKLLNDFPDGSAHPFVGDICKDRADEGIIETLQSIYATEPVDTLKVPFGDSFFTVSYNSNIPKIEREINKEVSGSVYYRFDRFVLTPYSLSFIVTDGPTGNTEEERIYSRTVSDFEVAVKLADGSTRKMQGLGDEPSGIAMPHGKAYKFYQFLDPIDINKVVTITVNGWEIYSAENSETAE